MTDKEAYWLMAFTENWLKSQHLERSIQQLMATNQRQAAIKLFSKQGTALFKESAHLQASKLYTFYAPERQNHKLLKTNVKIGSPT